MHVHAKETPPIASHLGKLMGLHRKSSSFRKLGRAVRSSFEATHSANIAQRLDHARRSSTTAFLSLFIRLLATIPPSYPRPIHIRRRCPTFRRSFLRPTTQLVFRPRRFLGGTLHSILFTRPWLTKQLIQIIIITVKIIQVSQSFRLIRFDPLQMFFSLDLKLERITTSSTDRFAGRC